MLHKNVKPTGGAKRRAPYGRKKKLHHEQAALRAAKGSWGDSSLPAHFGQFIARRRGEGGLPGCPPFAAKEKGALCLIPLLFRAPSSSEKQGVKARLRALFPAPGRYLRHFAAAEARARAAENFCFFPQKPGKKQNFSAFHPCRVCFFCVRL